MQEYLRETYAQHLNALYDTKALQRKIFYLRQDVQRVLTSVPDL